MIASVAQNYDEFGAGVTFNTKEGANQLTYGTVNQDGVLQHEGNRFTSGQAEDLDAERTYLDHHAIEGLETDSARFSHSTIDTLSSYATSHRGGSERNAMGAAGNQVASPRADDARAMFRYPQGRVLPAPTQPAARSPQPRPQCAGALQARHRVKHPV
jgi:hypothetical protein